MHFGSAWYPEHWPETRWPEDVRLMRDAGMNVCRIGEFAWSMMEPVEGQYEFGWLERAIALLHENGLAVVMGTPTAAPPAWLTHHHPDTLAIESNGRPAQHGNRCHYSPTSITYQKYARRIAEQMAKRFGKEERIIGWQIDNEYSRVDYSDHSQRQFQSFLREKFGSLGTLNRHWSTEYWSQTYTDWNEIPIPIGAHNPGLMLAFRQFVTQVWRDFQKVQIDALRMHIRPDQWITHNFMGWFDGFDHYQVAAELDIASWDWYVGTGHLDFRVTGAVHDLTRGLKRRNFWLMETQPGNVNWSSVNNALHKGESRCMAWHAVAHGADAILYWQWRSALGGQEQLHGTLVAPDGSPRPFYSEARQIGQELGSTAQALKGSAPKNDIAFLHSYDSRWSLGGQKHHKDFNPTEHFTHYYQEFAGRNVGVDVLSSEASLVDYRLVVAPGLVVLSETTVQNLTDFVHAGGTLVLTVRCGQKDAFNALFPTLQPGPLRELAGVEVEDYYALDAPAAVRAEWDEGRMGETRLWAERLRPIAEDVQELAHFGESNGWLDGGVAITYRPVGALGGAVVYVGGILDKELQASLTGWLMNRTGIQSVWRGLPDGLEAGRRVSETGRGVLILINHNRQTRSVALTEEAPSGYVWKDLLTGETFSGSIPFVAYGVRVFASE